MHFLYTISEAGMFMDKWKRFKEKYLGKISNILSWFFNILGLVLAIVSFIKNDADLGWGVVLSIVIFNSLFLIVVSIYESLLFKRGVEMEEEISQKTANLINELNGNYSQLDDRYRHSIIQRDKLRLYYKCAISTLNKFSTQLLYVNYKLEQTNEKIDSVASKAQNQDSDFESRIKSLKDDAYYEYERSMVKQFNQFLSDIIKELKIILDFALELKGCKLECSISVKQFNRIVFVSNGIPTSSSDVKVITTFRDWQTYSQGKREIGQKVYSVNKNTDFVYCLSHPYFLKNNILDSDRTYDNEHKGFLEYYNCAIVVPIKCTYPDSDHIFGYLTCDILNPDFTQNDLLDDKMAEVMEATANIMGLYFDDMDYQWEYVLDDDFLDIIFKLKNRTPLSK